MGRRPRRQNEAAPLYRATREKGFKRTPSAFLPCPITPRRVPATPPPDLPSSPYDSTVKRTAGSPRSARPLSDANPPRAVIRVVRSADSDAEGLGPRHLWRTPLTTWWLSDPAPPARRPR